MGPGFDPEELQYRLLRKLDYLIGTLYHCKNLASDLMRSAEYASLSKAAN